MAFLLFSASFFSTACSGQNFPVDGDRYGGAGLPVSGDGDLEMELEWHGEDGAEFDIEVEYAPGFVTIHPGTFIMGSPESELGRRDNETRHEVTLSRDFEIMAHEVTQGEFLDVMGVNPTQFESCGTDCPVETVSWNDAVAYSIELNKRSGMPPCLYVSKVSCREGGSVGRDYRKCFEEQGGRGGIVAMSVQLYGIETIYDCKGYRLPTEAEWEYAARAGSMTSTYAGQISQIDSTPLDDVLDRIAWYGGNSEAEYPGAYDCSQFLGRVSDCGPQPVGGKQSNSWGLFDMSGNVDEWVWDLYREDYQNDSPLDPEGADSGIERIRRGGSWFYGAKYCRHAGRSEYWAGAISPHFGFRLVRTLDKNKRWR